MKNYPKEIYVQLVESPLGCNMRKFDTACDFEGAVKYVRDDGAETHGHAIASSETDKMPRPTLSQPMGDVAEGMRRVTMPEGDTIEIPICTEIIAPCGDGITVKGEGKERTYWYKGEMIWNPSKFHRVGLMTVMLHEDGLRYEERKSSDLGEVVCDGCGRVGKEPPPPPALSCCPERRLVPVQDYIKQIQKEKYDLFWKLQGTTPPTPNGGRK